MLSTLGADFAIYSPDGPGNRLGTLESTEITFLYGDLASLTGPLVQTDISIDLGGYYDTASIYIPGVAVAATAPVPEPSTIALLGVGLVGLAGGAVRKKFKRKKE